jgi:small subunit ribosomal protein S9
MINGRVASEYVSRSDLFDVLYTAIKLTKLKDKVYFDVAVTGSGESAQVEAINYGIAKALLEKDSSLRAILKQAGLLTRDARKVERKKPGLHKARKAMQWSKR